MSEGPWIRFFPSDWLAGTRGLTAAETGVYITLCCLMYEAGGPIRRDDSRLARKCGMPVTGLAKALHTLIDEEKVTQNGDLLFNNRVGEELVRRQEMAGAAREKAKRRWHKNPSENNDDENAEASPQHDASTSPEHANQKSEPEPEPEREEPAPLRADASGPARDLKASLDRLYAVAGPGLADPAKEQGLIMTGSRVSAWLRDGADLELDIVPVIAARTALARASPITTWTYFDKPVAQAVANRAQGLPAVEISHAHHDRPAPYPARRSTIANFATLAD